MIPSLCRSNAFKQTGLTVLACVASLLTYASNAADGSFPLPKYVGDEAQLGKGIQRTMNLLASSTPDHRNTVKVLFYGQSITEQNWWKQVAEDLQARFPNANLVIENRAIGGHSSQLLVKTAEADLFPFYPDLVIFHVYGSHIDYESIIRGIRERTTAEILIQNDHVTKVADLAEETDSSKLSPKNWDAFMNHQFLPETARKYNTGFVDQRAAWKRYLTDNHLAPSDLLRDSVHLNDHGCFVMAEIVKAYLRVNPAVDDGGSQKWIRTYEGTDLRWADDRLVLEFEGNRIDAIAPVNPVKGESLEVWIDGRRPSEIASLRAFTRVSAFPRSNWPNLLRVQSGAPLETEGWTLTLTEVSDDLKTVKFKLRGLKTGEDGGGISAEKFVSNSKQIVIEPGDWNLEYCRRVFNRTLEPGYEITWQVVPEFHDIFNPAPNNDSATENAVVLVQGLTNGKHRLELRGNSGAKLLALKVYQPPLVP